MMAEAAKEKAVRLVGMIHDWGLTEFVGENFAYKTLCEILDTGRSLPEWCDETKEDIEQATSIYSRPSIWGLPKEEIWVDFIIAWEESEMSLK